jgi:nucleoside 2-deoxyribosyltransferase
MWFDPSMDVPYEEGFKKGIGDCGLDPRRVDKLEFVGKICDRILAEIRAAEIVVADFTGFRTGVFFEAGFALALGRTVIFTCQEDSAEQLGQHFDTRQYAHLLWSDAADLREKLSTRIRAIREVRPAI